MLKTIVPAALAYRDGVPYSPHYDDVYHAAEGALGQSRHVFLVGNGLPAAWGERSNFVVVETGFGAGLNFLVTWAAWRADPRRPARLDYVSVELHPFGGDDLARLHAAWPELQPLAAELRANWPLLTPGFHRLALDGGRVQLTLILGDVVTGLAQLEARADAFFLDGFAPDRNPEMWHPKVFHALARLAQPGATAATYSVTQAVREGLTRVGFVAERRPGFGHKRQCLVARLALDEAGLTRAYSRDRLETRSLRRTHAMAPRDALIVGAGVAGSALAHALAQRGVRVTVLDRNGIAEGASGNPLAVFRPVLSRDDNPGSRFTRAAFLHNLRAWPVLGERVRWCRSGILHLPKDAATARKFERALAENAPPPAYARWVTRSEASALANWPIDTPGIDYPQAGWIEPISLCRAWLDHPLIRVVTHSEVARLQPGSEGWQAVSRAGEVLAAADVVALANARDALALLPEQRWPLHPVRGQMSWLPAGTLPPIDRIIVREGYVARRGEQLWIGATYEHGDDDINARPDSDATNFARLDSLLPGAAQHLNLSQAEGRASLRATLPDRLPLAGVVMDAPGMYIAAGYGSRGVVWAGLLGETLADQMMGAPLPLERALMRAIAPGRFQSGARSVPGDTESETLDTLVNNEGPR